MELFQGQAKIVGIRFAKPTLAEQEQEDLILYVDVMVDRDKIIRNCKFTPIESFGEYPVLGDYYWVLIKDKEMRILDG